MADFLSTPVETNEIDLFEIKTYGSKMTPFYSILACWVGCTLLTSILKIEVKKSKVTKDAKNYQLFFGRFMLFASIALTQGLMIGLGDLFLGVQTINTPLFLLTLMVSSITFMLIIYSLTSTFGKIGQALSIVIMVLQVAGSGGTFPVELLPRGFQIMQPYMPFYPAMSAARETIGGFYGNDYIKYMLLLICHMIIPLIIGLVINKLTYQTKEKLKKELHSTEVME
ncbi:MAG: YhgE/Pip family protein [Bacilli bacterium]|nr:YhgE/Pip family protein [Bacilli bacterium]